MSTNPSIHFSLDEDTLKSAVVCVVCVVCCVGVGVGVWWWCCVLCVWCVFWCFCVVLLFFFNSLLSLSRSLSLSFSLSSLPLLSSLFCLLFLFFFSLLFATKHCGKNRSTNTAANFEAFECDLAHGRCTAVGSLPPSLSSLLPSLPLLLKKRRGNFLLQEYFRRRIYFY